MRSAGFSVSCMTLVLAGMGSVILEGLAGERARVGKPPKVQVERQQGSTQEPPLLSPSDGGQPSQGGPVQNVPVIPSSPPRFIQPPALSGSPLNPPRCITDPPAPKVVLRVRVVSCSPSGQALRYQICVENTSSAPAHHVLVRNPIPKNAAFVSAEPQPKIEENELRWYFGTVPACACREISLVLQPTNDEDIKNCARVQFEHGQCVVTRIAKAGPAAVLPVPKPVPQPPITGKEPPLTPVPVAPVGKLKLEIDGPKTYGVNEPAVYAITLHNVGPGIVTKPMIAVDLPKGLKFVSATKPGQFLAGHVAWLVGNLMAGEQRRVTLTVTAKEVGEICLRPFAIADQDLQAMAELCTTFRGYPASGLMANATEGAIRVGDKTTYVIEVFNQGGVPMTNLVIKAFVPKEMTVIQAEGPANTDRAVTPQGEIVTYKALKALPAKAVAKYQIVVKALQPGDVRFKVEMMADHLKDRGPVSEQVSTNIYSDIESTEVFSFQGEVLPPLRKE